MIIRPGFWLRAALSIALLGAAVPAPAQVVVDIIGDTAYATIALADEGGTVYTADVTIVFDTPLNLSAESLNLTAELVDPFDPLMIARLPDGVVVDPAFPMLITVEPPMQPWLFIDGFDGGASPGGALSFRNSYEIEVHTHDLVYTPNSRYRLLKAPLNGAFDDVTEDVLSGSTRARGRGGAFSQFVVGEDQRPLALLVVLDKLLDLDVRLLGAVLGDTLRLDLVALLVQVQVAVLVPLVGCLNALVPLDQFINEINAHAGIDIANLWRAEHDVTNDAGELQSLAHTLRFSLLSCSANP
jgi:hypothetical protein